MIKVIEKNVAANSAFRRRVEKQEEETGELQLERRSRRAEDKRAHKDRVWNLVTSILTAILAAGLATIISA